MLNNKQIREIYGEPGDQKNLVIVNLPYPHLFDHDLTKSTSKAVVHKLIADRYIAMKQALLDHYGLEKINELGINQTGGTFNHRPKRGYETQYYAAIERGDYETALLYLSTHSWAIAEDLDPNRNLLRESHKTARFAREEYKPMLEIIYAHQFLNYGVEKDYDWMHTETAV